MRHPSGDALHAVGPDGSFPETLGRLAVLSSWPGELHGLLAQVVAACVPVFGDGVEVSVALGEPTAPTAVATSSALAQRMDGAQLTAAQGPSHRAFSSARTVVVPDAHVDERWPLLAAVMPKELHGVVATPLVVGSAYLGVLSLYSRDIGWGDRLLQSVELLGATVAAVVRERTIRADLEQLAADLGRALDSRAVIDQAKGMLMAEHRWDEGQAFQHLLDVSSSTGVKLRDVARSLVARRSGARPERPGASLMTRSGDLSPLHGGEHLVGDIDEPSTR